MKYSVCKECGERKVGCHAVCAKFLAECIRRDRENRKKILARETEKAIDHLQFDRWAAQRRKGKE